MKESTFPFIPDDIVAVIIDFAYSGVTTFTGPQLTEVLKAAHYLQMSKLLKLCEEKITVVAEPSNCFSWAEVAEELGLSYIASTIQKMLRATYSEVIKTEEYKQLEMEELAKYLTDVRDHGSCSDDLVRGALQWIKHDTFTRSTHMKDLFMLANIGKCSEHYLLKLVEDNAEVLEMQQSMYKMMLSDVLNASKPALLGIDKTVLILGGKYPSGLVNYNSWILEKDQLVKFCDQRDKTLQASQSICIIPGGLMWTGGLDSDLCTIFVCSAKLWVKQEPMRRVRSSHGSGYVTGRVFVISGNVLGSESCSVDFMDFDGKKNWQNGPPLPSSELLPKVVVFNSELFVLLSAKGKLYQLRLEEMSWSSKAPIPQPSRGCSVAASEHRIFAAGGDHNINFMYNPAVDVWCQLTGPSLAARQGAMVYYQHKLYLFAGCRRVECLTDVEEYDIRTDRWSLTKWKLPRPLWQFGAFLIDRP